MQAKTAWTRQIVMICLNHYNHPPEWVPALGEVLDARGHRCVPGCIGRAEVHIHVRPTGDADGWIAYWCGEGSAEVHGLRRPSSVGGSHYGPAARAMAENDGADLVSVVRSSGRPVKCFLDDEEVRSFRVRTYDPDRKAWA